jgi:hypothetical protein
VWGMNLVLSSHMFKLPFKVSQIEPAELSDMLLTSWTVILLFYRTNSFTLSTFSSVFLVDGCPDRSALSSSPRFLTRKPLKNLCFSHYLLS